MKVNSAIIKKSEVSVAMLKVFGYSVRFRRADDTRFESDRIQVDRRWSEEIFHKAADFIRNSVGCKVEPNLKEMTMEMIISDEMMGNTPMVSLLTRKMTPVEEFEAAQERRVLPD